MELPVSGLDAFLEWQERLTRFESSGLSIDAFCRQEDVDRSQFANGPAICNRPLLRLQIAVTRS